MLRIKQVIEKKTREIGDGGPPLVETLLGPVVEEEIAADLESAAHELWIPIFAEVLWSQPSLRRYIRLQHYDRLDAVSAHEEQFLLALFRPIAEKQGYMLIKRPNPLEFTVYPIREDFSSIGF